MMNNFFLSCIFYGSHLVWIFLWFSLWILYQSVKILPNKREMIVAFFAILLSFIFIYIRFIEPQLIVFRDTHIDAPVRGKLVVISDLHLGVYKSKEFLERVTSKINSLSWVNAVLIAWDFTFTHDTNDDFRTEFSPLQKIQVPVYAVLWNHDLWNPWPDFGDSLKRALKENHVHLLENESVSIPQTDFTLLWLGEHWSFNDQVSLLENFWLKNHLIVLTHNPDTVPMYPWYHELLTISWHTHGGQVRLPFLYKYMIPCEYDFDRGLSYYEKHLIFITSWLWETALPIRFLNPPVIDILEFGR